MRVVVWVLVASGCRIGFDPESQTLPARDAPALPLDAFEFRDAPRSPVCNQLIPTPEECAAARADPASAPDQILFDCATSCAFDGCYILEKNPDCPTCACNYYVKSEVICDSGGACGAPLNGTGCITTGGFTQAPFNCPNGTSVEVAACVLRVLHAMSNC
jgi:hypothetical protein